MRRRMHRRRCRRSTMSQLLCTQCASQEVFDDKRNAATNCESVSCGVLRIEKAERGGFEPPVGLKPYTDLANRRIRPLCHLSDPRADGREYSGLTSERKVRAMTSGRLVAEVVRLRFFPRHRSLTLLRRRENKRCRSSYFGSDISPDFDEGCFGPNST